MVAWWAAALLFVGSTVLSVLMQRRQIRDVAPSSLGDLRAPTAEEGRPVPVIFGTVLLRSPNVVWYGDLRVVGIKQKAGGFFGIGAKEVTVGYKYHVGMDLALCHGPVDALVDIRAGSGEDVKPISFQQAPAMDGMIAFQLNDPKAFGGEQKEGGISGPGALYLGTQTQGSDSYMSSRLSISYPAYRGLCHAVCRQIYVGTSPYLKDLAFVLRRCPSNLGLGTNQTNINGDANPAEIIYEILRSSAWGLGLPQSRIDRDSFRAAASTLATEGMGMSLQLDTGSAADQVITDILRHIDGVLYTDPATGLWTLKLARGDYNPETLPEFGPSDVLEAPDYSRGSWEETLNEIKVEYLDRSTFKSAIVQAQDTAGYALRGETAGETMRFLGISSPALAQKIAMRELRTYSYPLVKVRLKVNRKGWSLRMADVFRFTWPEYGIEGMPLRITGINYGTLDSGEIEIESCEDVFGQAYTAYDAPPPSGWSDPVSVPSAPVAQLAIEAPYQMLDGVAAPRVLVGAVRADGVSMGYEVWTDEGAGYAQTSVVPMFCPSGLLRAAYSRTTAALDTVGITLDSGVDLDVLTSTDAAGRDRGDNLLLFADTGEICAWQGITRNSDGSYSLSGIVRGCYDTLPADHAQNTRVYIIRGGRYDLLADYRSMPLEDSGDDSIVLND